VPIRSTDRVGGVGFVTARDGELGTGDRGGGLLVDVVARPASDGAAARQATLTAALLLLAMAVGGCEEPSGSYPLPPPSDPHYADAWIAREVLRRLEGDRQLGRFLIHVQAHETVVYLQGTVPSEELRRRAQQLAERSPYVYAVRNNIAVVTRPLPPD